MAATEDDAVRAVARLARRFEAEGWSAVDGDQADADLVLTKGARTFVVNLKRWLRDYVHRYAPEVTLALAAVDGELQIYGPEIAEVHESRDALAPGKHRLSMSRASLFTDANRWMLKVLLARWLPERYLSAPRERIRSTNDLARVADVSRVVARRLLALLRSEGYLLESPHELALGRVEELLERWRAHNNSQPPIEIRARWLLPKGGDQLFAALRTLAPG